MKTFSKILIIILLVFGLSLFFSPSAFSMAQISMQNNTGLWLTLYIDGYFGCGPVMPNGFCTSSVKPGVHLLEARKGQELIASQTGVEIGTGHPRPGRLSSKIPTRL